MLFKIPTVRQNIDRRHICRSAPNDSFSARQNSNLELIDLDITRRTDRIEKRFQKQIQNFIKTYTEKEIPLKFNINVSVRGQNAKYFRAALQKEWFFYPKAPTTNSFSSLI